MRFKLIKFLPINKMAPAKRINLFMALRLDFSWSTDFLLSKIRPFYVQKNIENCKKNVGKISRKWVGSTGGRSKVDRVNWGVNGGQVHV